MTAALAAAHVGHQVEHSSALMGFLIGAAVGLAIGVAVVATVASGGTALAIIAAVGGAVAATGGMALAGKYIGEAITSPMGPISMGSFDVKYGAARMLAARAVVDPVACSRDGPAPMFIATGSDSVFINNFPAARRTDKTTCGGTIGSDLDHIFIGAATAQYLDIRSEVPDWMVGLAQGMVVVGTAVALSFGLAAAALAGGVCGVISFFGTTAGGLLGGMGGAELGGYIGEAIGGELGRRIGEVAGGLLGGLFGARVGNRMSTGHPIDVSTGELFTSDTDLAVPGIIPIVWERFWISGSTQNGALGHGWHHSYDMAIAQGTNATVLRMEHGRLIILPQLVPGDVHYNRAEKLSVHRAEDGRYVVQTETNELLIFAASPSDASQFHLSYVGDPNGNWVSLNYDERERLSQILSLDERGFLLNYDDRGFIVSVDRLFESVVVPGTLYEYDKAGDLISATDATGVPITYAYDQHLIVRETRRSGLSFHFVWDDASQRTNARCVRTWGDGEIYVRNITYDIHGRSTSVRDGMGEVKTYHWNDRGLVTGVVSPLGAETKKKWSKWGELEEIRDPTGNVEASTYDDFGRVFAFRDKSGATTHQSYSSDDPRSPVLHAIATETDPLGAVSVFDYDIRGNIAAITDPLGHTLRILHDDKGLAIATMDDLGTVARYRYSTSGDLVEERSALGGRILYEYDSRGRLVSEQAERESPIHYAYTDLDQIARVISADGGETRIAYDIEGNVVEVVDAVGRRTRWDFGRLPFPIRRINPDGTAFDYRYDGELNLTFLRNEVGDVYRLEYDSDGNLVREVGFDGRVQTYEFDLAGQLIGSTDGARTHQFERDPMGRLIGRASSDGTDAAYAYDAVGRMTAAVNEVRSCGFVYDRRGLLIEETQDGRAVTHSYSPRGARTATMLPDGRMVQFSYDRNGDFAGLRFQDRDVLSIDRDRRGREAIRNGGPITQRTDYDPQGRITRQTAYRKDGREPVFGRAFRFDKAGLITEIKDLARGTRQFQYDAREQLRTVLGESPEVFAFDPAGQILAGALSPLDASVRGGRLMMQGDNHYQYDEAGNRIRLQRGWAGTQTYDYSYDAQNQLTEVIETAPTRITTVRFTYDALSRRVSKAVSLQRRRPHAANDVPDPDMAPLEMTETIFLWAGDVLLGEGDAADPLALVYVYEPETFRPAAQIRRHDTEAEGEVFLYWLDHLGTPQEITNERGELVWEVALKAWGGIDRVLVDRVGNSLRFQGQYYDRETGLHYNRFRHYDPQNGAFINQDPIGLLGSEVAYAYAPNPTAWIDPLGLNPCQYSGNPQRTRGSNGQQHADAAVRDAALLRQQGYTQGTYNRNINSSMRQFGLNPVSGSQGRLRPDVIGYNPKTNTVRIVENPSPSQTSASQLAKANQMANAIRQANPNVNVAPPIIQR